MGVRSGKVKRPDSLVRVARRKPVRSLERVTSMLGMAAPVESWMEPERVPEMFCAVIEAHKRNSAQAARSV